MLLKVTSTAWVCTRGLKGEPAQAGWQRRSLKDRLWWVLDLAPDRGVARGLKGLTFITDSETNVGVALVRGEQEVQEVGGADEELGNLSALVAPN